MLPYSTGVIMEPLPVDKIIAALPAAKAAARADGWFAAANAIMTTDTVPKGASRQVVVDGVAVTVTGIAKGAGMIHPNMATMLSFMATDAPLASAVLAQLVREVADVSFNGATVDGDTSTNDSFVLAATGRAKISPITSSADPRLVPIQAAIEACAVELAQAIVRDGEGATKFIAIRVEGGRDVDECKRIAFGIAPLAAGQDRLFCVRSNLGRIVCAIGNTAAPDTDPAPAFRSGSTTCWSLTTAAVPRVIAKKMASA